MERVYGDYCCTKCDFNSDIHFEVFNECPNCKEDSKCKSCDTCYNCKSKRQ